VGRSTLSDTTTHVVRVELRPDLYREMEVFSGMPLDFFAAAIVKAFGFDFDHPYGCMRRRESRPQERRRSAAAGGGKGCQW